MMSNKSYNINVILLYVLLFMEVIYFTNFGHVEFLTSYIMLDDISSVMHVVKHAKFTIFN